MEKITGTGVFIKAKYLQCRIKNKEWEFDFTICVLLVAVWF